MLNGLVLEPHHPIGFFGLAAQDQDRNRRGIAHLSCEREPIFSGKTQIDHQQVDRLVLDDVQHLAAARDCGDPQVLLAQILNEHFPDVRIVVQGQDVRSDGFHGGLVGAPAGEFRLQPGHERGLMRDK